MNFAFWFKTSFSSVTSQLLLFTFHQEKKNQKHDINTFVKGAHFTSNVVCRQESPAAGLTSLCLRSAHICMSYYNAAARGLLGGAVQTDRKGRHRGKTRRPMLPAAPCSQQPHAPSSPMLPAALLRACGGKAEGHSLEEAALSSDRLFSCTGLGTISTT